MFPPHAGPPPVTDRSRPLGEWARLESKSPTVEADLLRLTYAARPGTGWRLGPTGESLVAWLLTFFDS